MRTLRAPDYEHASAGKRGVDLANEYQWPIARIAASASIVAKARRNSAAPIPANGLRNELAKQMDDPVSDPFLPIAISKSSA